VGNAVTWVDGIPQGVDTLAETEDEGGGSEAPDGEAAAS
jgi:ATP-dependent Lhr-like helicase